MRCSFLKLRIQRKLTINVKPRLPGKMCTLTSVVQMAESACHRSNNAKKKDDLYQYTKAFRASWCVHSAHGVCVLQNTLVINKVLSSGYRVSWWTVK